MVGLKALRPLNLLKMKRITTLSLLFVLFSCSSPAFGGDEPIRMTPQDYIARYKEDAIRDMQKTGVPASITLAQGMFESENGNSRLAREANNHFGIKCHKEWSGPTFIKDDDTKNECFRKYETVLESYDDHSNFLRTRERYQFLFEYEITDYKNWAHGLKKAGYATNPEYANKLIRIIEENNLSQYDGPGKTVAVTKPGSSSPAAPAAMTAAAEKKTVENTSSAIVNNNVKYVVAKKGDSYLSIAQQEDVMLWELLKYNDADKGTSVSEGEIVYLKPKRNKAATGFHTVKEGETLRSISQLYGIKLKALAKRNHLSAYTDPPAGTKLSLN